MSFMLFMVKSLVIHFNGPQKTTAAGDGFRRAGSMHRSPPDGSGDYVGTRSRWRLSGERGCKTRLTLGHRGGLRNPQKEQKGLTEGLGTAFPEKQHASRVGTAPAGHPSLGAPRQAKDGGGGGSRTPVLSWSRVSHYMLSPCLDLTLRSGDGRPNRRASSLLFSRVGPRVRGALASLIITLPTPYQASGRKRHRT